MVKESMNAEIASAEKARGPQANAGTRVCPETDMGASSGLARRQANRGPFSSKKNAKHYVYRLTDPATGEYYFGRRTCHGKPEADSKYMGKGVWPVQVAQEGRAITKQVVAVFRKINDALAHESALIAASTGDPLNMNRAGRSEFWNDAQRERVSLWVTKEHAALIREYAASLVAASPGPEAAGLREADHY
jgi:hypothetical protein